MNRMIRSGVGMLFASFAFWATFMVLGASLFGGMNNRLIMTVGSPERQYFYSRVGWVVTGSLAAMAIAGAIAFWKASALLKPRMIPLGRVAAGLGLVLFLLTIAYLPFLALVLGMPASKPDSSGNHSSATSTQTPDPSFIPG